MAMIMKITGGTKESNYKDKLKVGGVVMAYKGVRKKIKQHGGRDSRGFLFFGKKKKGKEHGLWRREDSDHVQHTRGLSEGEVRVRSRLGLGLQKQKEETQRGRKTRYNGLVGGEKLCVAGKVAWSHLLRFWGSRRALSMR